MTCAARRNPRSPVSCSASNDILMEYVLGLMRSALLWGSENRWLEGQFRRRRFAKKAVKRFMPGEEPEDALREAKTLSESGVASVVTLLGENVANEAEVRGVVEHYSGVLDLIGNSGLNCHVSVKLTAMGLDLSPQLAADNLVHLASLASKQGHTLWVDMEYSRYVDATLSAFETARAHSPNLALCLQAYLHRTPEDLDRILDTDSPIRLVKGAYAEPPDVAIPNKADVDQAFRVLALRMLSRPPSSGQGHGVATHDISLIEKVLSEASRSGLGGRAEVQMLYGIQRPAQLKFAKRGVPTRVLISYGTSWFPWYMRRLAERPANVGFVLRSMVAG